MSCKQTLKELKMGYFIDFHYTIADLITTMGYLIGYKSCINLPVSLPVKLKAVRPLLVI